MNGLIIIMKAPKVIYLQQFLSKGPFAVTKLDTIPRVEPPMTARIRITTPAN